MRGGKHLNTSFIYLEAWAGGLGGWLQMAEKADIVGGHAFGLHVSGAACRMIGRSARERVAWASERIAASTENEIRSLASMGPRNRQKRASGSRTSEAR